MCAYNVMYQLGDIVRDEQGNVNVMLFTRDGSLVHVPVTQDIVLLARGLVNTMLFMKGYTVKPTRTVIKPEVGGLGRAKNAYNKYMSEYLRKAYCDPDKGQRCHRVIFREAVLNYRKFVANEQNDNSKDSETHVQSPAG